MAPKRLDLGNRWCANCGAMRADMFQHPSLTVGAGLVLDLTGLLAGQIEIRSLSQPNVRLQLASRIFAFFAKLRGRHGIDVESFQIILGFVLAGLAEINKRHEQAFAPASFEALLTATALSEMTGIPRQTVRRKLAALEALGLVAREADGGYKMANYPSDLDILQIIQTTLEPGSAPRPV